MDGGKTDACNLRSLSGLVQCASDSSGPENLLGMELAATPCATSCGEVRTCHGYMIEFHVRTELKCGEQYEHKLGLKLML